MGSRAKTCRDDIIYSAHQPADVSDQTGKDCTLPLLPPHYLDSTVALGTPDSRGSVRFTATGFLYGYPTGHDDQFTVYLITNEHVIRGESVLKMRLNHSEDTTPQVLDLHLGGELERFVERDAVHDVAVIGLSDSLLDVPGIDLRFIAGDQRVTIETGGELGISEGDGVFVLGFPMGMAGDERNYPIVRQGCLARVRDWLNGKSSKILIDSFIFPGNSGGPVITRPDGFALQGMTPNRSALLLGMVSAYVPYVDVARSEQTRNVRVIFEENSGLAEVVPADIIHDAVRSLRERLSQM